MGYDVTIKFSSVTVPAEHLAAAYKACVELNDRDDLKGGGRHPEKEWDKTKDKWNPNKWFSWMKHNWPDTCGDLQAVFTELGFDSHYDDEGGFVIDGYCSKIGDEEHFLRAIAPYVVDGGVIDWVGEDYEFWRTKFVGGRMTGSRLRLVEDDA